MINMIISRGLSGGVWTVNEKVHGSNFSVWHDMESDEVKFAKRSGFLGDGNFFNSHSIQPRLEKQIRKIREVVPSAVKQVAIFGELCGGNYPHPDVENQSAYKAVQKEVWYSPNLEYMPFDLAFDGVYVNVHTANHNFTHAGMNYLKPLFEGTFEECLEFKNKFQSTVPEYFGLPLIEDNTCEGIVIKPVEPAFFGDDMGRVILKSKNAKFSEKGDKMKAPKEAIILEGKPKEVVEELFSLVTENRLKNVISKIGEVTRKDFGKLQGGMVQDIFEEYLKDNSLDDLEQKVRKTINKMLGTQVSLLIRPNFANIIDGEF